MHYIVQTNAARKGSAGCPAFEDHHADEHTTAALPGTSGCSSELCISFFTSNQAKVTGPRDSPERQRQPANPI